jgi:thiamine-monophosphate kinase
MSAPLPDIARLGEFGIVRRIRDQLDAPVPRAELLASIGDDAAVYRTTPGTIQLLTTDALVEGIHFDLTFTSLKHLGWKSIVASVSDIAAMGGSPRYATVALSLPNKITVAMIDDLTAGMRLACKEYGCAIVGGDTTASLGNTTIVVTLTGEAEERLVRYRSGAKNGDYLCVTGHLGASMAGLKVLQREKRRFLEQHDAGSFRPSLGEYAAAIERHLMPKARLDLAGIIAASAHAMIDISDGLASEVHHICSSSGVGAQVYEHSLPVDAVTQKIAGEFSEQPTDYALYGGEEYELLFTVADTDWEKLEEQTNDVTVIGRIKAAEAGIELIREQGEHEPLLPGGWDHFRKGAGA